MSSSSGSATQAYYPLGLPPGSVRAILTIMIAGLFWLLTIVPQPPDAEPVHVPLFLFALLPMVLLFFAAHGKSIRPPGENVASPLYLPAGVIRVLLVAGFVAALGYQWYLDRQTLEVRLTPAVSDLWKFPPILLVLGVGFLAGHVARIGPWSRWPAYQNLVAWVSLISMLLMLVIIVIELVIKPGLTESIDPFTFYLECITTGAVAFYFGARS